MKTCVALFLSILTAAAANAAITLDSGSATITFSAPAWATVAGGANSPGFEALTLDEFFDKAASDARTFLEIFNDEVQANPPYAGQIYEMNGASVLNLAGRFSQPTNFSYEIGNPTGATGIIGLGGVTRWDVNPALGGGQIVVGEYDIHFDATRLSGPFNASGWVLMNHAAGEDTVAFDLANVIVTATGTGFSVSGDLAVSYETANFLFGTPSDQGKSMGTLSFSAAASVPEPSSAVLLMLGCVAAAARRRR